MAVNKITTCSDETRFQGIATGREGITIRRGIDGLAVTRPVFRGLRPGPGRSPTHGAPSRLAVTRPVFRGLRPIFGLEFPFNMDQLAVTRPVFRGLRRRDYSDHWVSQAFTQLAVTRPVFRGLRQGRARVRGPQGGLPSLAVTRPVFRGLRLFFWDFDP